MNEETISLETERTPSSGTKERFPSAETADLTEKAPSALATTRHSSASPILEAVLQLPASATPGQAAAATAASVADRCAMRDAVHERARGLELTL